MAYQDYAKLIHNAAANYGGTDAKAIKNFEATLTWLLGEESTWDPTAGNKSGAYGIGQFMPETAKEMGLIVGNQDNRGNAALSIDAAARLLKKNLEYFTGQDDQVLKAVAAYNAGAKTVDNTVKAQKSVSQTVTSAAGKGSSLVGGPGKNLGKNWTAYLPGETQQYISDFTTHQLHGKSDPNVDAIWAGTGGANAYSSHPTITGPNGKQIPPAPTLEDFSGDYAGYIDAVSKWESLYGTGAAFAKRAADDQHATLLLDELAKQISSGQLSLDAATKNFDNYVKSATFDYSDLAQQRVANAVKPGTQYFPGTEPGNGLGINPVSLQLGNSFNPFKTAMDLKANIPDLGSIVSHFTNPSNISSIDQAVEPSLANAGSTMQQKMQTADAGMGYNAFRQALQIVQGQGTGAASGSPASWLGGAV